MNGIWGIVGAGITVIGTITMGFLTYRGTRTAARINAGPAGRQVDLSVLQASVDRLKEECSDLRQEQVRTRGVLWSISRWALVLRDQVVGAGETPQPPPSDVEDFYRTGV
ncbi:hypothetical protein MUK60_07130 [Streptomyces sp. LRE541]|uniref:hypothetical protein n=1 Tax=Streptomyces sp. LRE541 TaxID=2931983 RepID=UPI00200BF8D5|nr:hypothetical protein [Streptomyces sp. LRE541]UPZ27604.1 hypothetical protein MUK60_07130 [Streptomyces sp. LRE541]